MTVFVMNVQRGVRHAFQIKNVWCVMTKNFFLKVIATAIVRKVTSLQVVVGDVKSVVWAAKVVRSWMFV